MVFLFGALEKTCYHFKMIIGLTGRTSSGKSLAINILKQKFDFQLFDLDQIGHELLLKPEIKDQLLTEFGASILLNQEISRPKLANIVFLDLAKLKKLNQIMHPEIKNNVLAKIKNLSKNIIICGALIKEIGLETNCDIIVVIDAEDDLITEKVKFAQISKFQRSREDFLNDADVVIRNNFDDDFEEELIEVFSGLLQLTP